MTRPNPVTLPPQNDTNWYQHYAWLDATARYVGAAVDTPPTVDTTTLLTYVFWDGITGAQPVRPLSDTSKTVVWMQPSAPPVGGSYAVNGRDVWFKTS